MIQQIDQPQTMEERFLLEKLHELRLSYERDAKPYLDRLTQIRCMRIPKYVLIPDPAAEQGAFRGSLG